MLLVQKAGAIQNPTDIDIVDKSGVRLSNEVGKLLVGTRLVNGVIHNHLSRRVEHPTADAIMPLDVLEQGEVCHVLVYNSQHDIGGIAVLTSSPRFKPRDSSHRFAVGEVLVSKRLPRIRV